MFPGVTIQWIYCGSCARAAFSCEVLTRDLARFRTRFNSIIDVFNRAYDAEDVCTAYGLDPTHWPLALRSEEMKLDEHSSDVVPPLPSERAGSRGSDRIDGRVFSGTACLDSALGNPLNLARWTFLLISRKLDELHALLRPGAFVCSPGARTLRPRE